jgi:drug/metabolite transporter (DMT)-like permease
MQTHDQPGTARLFFVLATALFALSASAILVRQLPGLDATAIAWWRCLGTTLLLVPFLRPLSQEDAARVAFGGAALGLHFAAWFASLKLTTVMHATVLVCMTPAWVGLYEWRVGGAKLGTGFWGGLAASVLGVVLMTTDAGEQTSLWGDALALFASLLAMVFVLVGKEVRQRVGIASYGGWLCASATLCLTPLVWLQGVTLTSVDTAQAGFLLLCVLGPQLIGHNGFNYALRYLPATSVSSLLLLEPVGATLLAMWFLGEHPEPIAGLGGTLVVLGVILANRASISAAPELPAVAS